MDGTIKTVQKEYIEEGGMIFEDMRVDSIPSYLEKHLLEEVLGEFELPFVPSLSPRGSKSLDLRDLSLQVSESPGI